MGKYELLDLLGRGGCGEVWKARDAELGRVVALKLMQRTDAEDLSRFKREAHVVAQLSHPNIAQLYEFSVEPPYLAMQYIEGGPISDAKEKIAALRDAARAVHFAHQRGILHRDLKPANIMVDTAGRASVLDFGLAREVKGDQTAMTLSGDILGTPSYMAPEQARGDVKNLDARTDAYGLGATLYFLLTGRPPHTGATAFDVIRSVLDVEPSRPGGDRDLETICLKSLEKDPARRYASAEEFAADLDRYLRQEPVRARPASTLYRLKKKIQRHPAVWSLSVLLVAAILVGTVFGIVQLIAKRREAEKALEAERAKSKEQERQALIERATASILEAEQLLPDPTVEFKKIQSKLRATIAELEAGLKTFSGDAKIFFWLGRADDLLWEDDDAILWFSKAIEREPGASRAYLFRARVRLRQFLWTKLRRGPHVGDELAGLLMQVSADLSKAKKDPTTGLEFRRALWFLELANWDDTAKPKKELEDLIALGGRTEEAWCLLGIWTLIDGDVPGSLKCFDQSLNLHPRNVEALYARGLARSSVGDAAGAVEDLTNALNLKANFPEALKMRAVARGMTGDDAGAVEDCTRAIRLRESDGQAYYQRGLGRSKLGDYAGAIEDYTKSIARDADAADAFNSRGAVRAKLGDFKGAADDFARALDLAPRDSPLRRTAERNLKEARRRLDGAGDF